MKSAIALAVLALVLAMPLAAVPAAVGISHDKKPASFWRVTRDACFDPDDKDGDKVRDYDCDDPRVVGTPVDGGWAPTIVLGLGTGMVLWLSRRKKS